MRGLAEVSIPEVKGDEASASAQEVVCEPAQREQLDGDAQGSESTVAKAEKVQNKANLESRQVAIAQDVTSRIASQERAEQTQSRRPADSASVVRQSALRHDRVPIPDRPTDLSHGTHVDPDRDCDGNGLGDLQDGGEGQHPGYRGVASRSYKPEAPAKNMYASIFINALRWRFRLVARSFGGLVSVLNGYRPSPGIPRRGVPLLQA